MKAIKNNLLAFNNNITEKNMFEDQGGETL